MNRDNSSEIKPAM